MELLEHMTGRETTSEKWINADVCLKEVDPLTYGELIAIHASVDALNVDGPYVFVTYDGNLYIGEYEDEDLRFYCVITALKRGRE